MNKRLIIVVAILLLSATAFSQSENAHMVAERFASAPSKNLLPDGPGAWVINIVTTGGFTGQGLPTLTIRSTGDFACGEADDLRFGPLDPAAFQPFWQYVTGAKLSVDKSSPRSGDLPGFICNDCYDTRVFLTRRKPDGKVGFYKSTADSKKYASYSEIFDRIKKGSKELASCDN